MLKFWNSESFITNVADGQQSYLVYGDDEIPHKFYIVPNRPTIALNESNKLSFRFIKYRFARNTAEKPPQSPGGGYLVFDVVLRVPDVAKADILKQLREKYTKRLAKAEAAETAAKGSTDTNLKDIARRARQQTDGVLDVSQIEVAPVPFQDGTVTLNIKKDKDENSPFVQQVPTLGKPSKDGNNTASFAVELTTEGATFFEKAMSGDAGGAVQVLYSLKTWFRSSDTEIIARYDKTNAMTYQEEISKQPRIWAETKIDKTISASLQKYEVVKCDIKWSEGSYTEEQKASIRKWATDAVADAVKRQIPDLTQPGASDSLGKRTYNLSATSDFEQRYCENFAMLMELNPQGMLPNVGSIAKPGGAGNFDWKDYFQEVDLDDPFFKTLRLGVTADIDFDTSPVSRVAVDLWATLKTGSDTRTVTTTLTFGKGFAARQFWDPFISEQEYSYQYKLYYKQGLPFTSKRMTAVTKEQVIGHDADGLLVVDVVANGIIPAVIRQTIATIQPIDPTTKEPKGFPTQVTLNKASPQGRATLAVGNELVPPYSYEYSVQFALEPDGSSISLPPAILSNRQLSVPSPFANYRAIDIRAPGLTEGNSLFLQLAYKEKSGYTRKTTLTLDADTPASKWVVGVNDPTGELTYQGEFDNKDGTSSTVAPQKAGSDLIMVRRTDAQSTDFQVTVDPTLIDWEGTGLQVLEVTVTYGAIARKAVFRLGKAPNPIPALQNLTWTRQDGTASYTWKAVYTVKKNGKVSRIQTAPDTSEEANLMLSDPIAEPANA